MMDVYKNCPTYENESYMLRMISKNDKADLLKVYSNEKSVSLFNSDNCGGDGLPMVSCGKQQDKLLFDRKKVVLR